MDRIDDLIDAVTTLAKKLRPEDSASLITFSEQLRFLVPMTRERPPLLAALNGLVADGYTSLNDAVFLGMQMRPADVGDTRPVLLIFSDGQDSSSWLSSRQLIDAARRSGIVIHVVEMSSNPRGTPLANSLANAGGGRVWRASSGRDLRELFGKVLEELRARYLLTYSASDVDRDGWHDVKVTLKGARGDVTARPGYFIAPQ